MPASHHAHGRGLPPPLYILLTRSSSTSQGCWPLSAKMVMGAEACCCRALWAGASRDASPKKWD